MPRTNDPDYDLSSMAQLVRLRKLLHRIALGDPIRPYEVFYHEDRVFSLQSLTACKLSELFKHYVDAEVDRLRNAAPSPVMIREVEAWEQIRAAQADPGGFTPRDHRG